ncbi:FCD domain-containing protein [Nonomuraea ferruginea]
MARKSLRAALRDHEKIVDAIEAGDGARAVKLATAHLDATRSSSLGASQNDLVNTDLLDNIDYGTR